MGKVRFYDFQERLRFSDGQTFSGKAPHIEAVCKILLHRIPGCINVERMPEGNDRAGCDFEAQRKHTHSLQIDLKLRAKDYRNGRNSQDDLALETWSVIDPKTGEGKEIGWTRDERKCTDYILWYWSDTGRFCLLPFPPLCYVFNKYWKSWCKIYRTERQSSGRWESECVFVPRKEVSDKIASWSMAGRKRLEEATA